MLTNCVAACTHVSSTVSQLFEPQVQKKSPLSRTAAHIFVSPGIFVSSATITQYVAWMERQFNACQTPRSMNLSIFNSFRVIRCLSQVQKSLFYHIFVSPGDAPGAITLNVAWMERKFDAYKLSRSMYPSNYNRFSCIRTASAKNRRYHVPQTTFLFPLETPLRLSRNMLHGWKDNSMLPKSLAVCTYVSIFNCFQVIRCLSQCVSPKIANFTTFLAITLNVVWIERKFDAYKLSGCMCPSKYNRF